MTLPQVTYVGTRPEVGSVSWLKRFQEELEVASEQSEEERDPAMV